jgi:hypothetical protein
VRYGLRSRAVGADVPDGPSPPFPGEGTDTKVPR